MKISKGIGIIAGLRHLFSFSAYRSLIEPYISYGLVAWGQALNTHLNKIVTLQKRALPFMYFVDYKSHSVPLFLNSGILPVKLLYFKSVASFLHDVDNRHAPPNISNLFTRSKQIHSYPTRSAIAGNFHVEMSRTNQRLLSSSRIGTKIWNGIPPKIRQLKKSRKLNELLLKFLKIEEMNVDMRYINLSKYMAFL